MALIKRRTKELLKPVTFRLPESLLDRLARYADFANVPQAEIVAAAVAYAVDSDKDFSAECTHSAIQPAVPVATPARTKAAETGSMTYPGIPVAGGFNASHSCIYYDTPPLNRYTQVHH